MMNIRAIYENGAFRPLDPVDLPEGTRVQLQVVRILGVELNQDLDAIYKAMDQRYDTGETDIAARHNEHQP